MNNTATLSNKSIVESFSEVLGSLSIKEQDVIKKRIWLLWKRETLQNIWSSFKPTITRERVRQIEDTWIKKIWRMIKTNVLSEIQSKSKEFLSLHWGILSKKKLINILIKELNIEKNINKWILEVIIQSDSDLKKSKQTLWCEIYFFYSDVSKQTIDLVHKEALKILKKKKDVMDQKTLYEIIKDNLKSRVKLSTVFIDSVLELFFDIIKWEDSLIGLSKWKILNPKTLKDKAIYVMKKEKVPMHFVDIANKITDMLWEAVKVNTIHNELIRNREFVLIGRWIYALKEYWFTPWTVLDVIVDILSKKWEAMNTEDIIKDVLKIRKVKPTTIYMNLQNKNTIERVWRNYYQLLMS